MPDQGRDREILQRLAEGLTDEQLRELFPDREPQAIRDALLLAAGVKPTAPARRSAPTLPFAGQNTQNIHRPPRGGNCFLYADGASRGNPGEAGAGVVLLDADRHELDTRALYLGLCTNNAAEYRALIAGLELALQNGCDRLSIRLDSELIVRQITGEYKVKNAQLQPLYLKVKGLLQQLASWNIRHVPRAENARADQLANQGIDERKSRIGADA